MVQHFKMEIWYPKVCFEVNLHMSTKSCVNSPLLIEMNIRVFSVGSIAITMMS